jgi:BirA family transcriptional regulator, biotin operon repressor / biotin---[acetyl-CoA-carboxylase] ligase
VKATTWLPVLRQLSDGALISGEELGDSIGVTRAAIWQRVAYLKSLGVSISANDYGYQVQGPVYLPNADLIGASIEVPVRFEPEVSSTNTLVLESRQPQCLLTLYQKQGRGRRGRQWVAAPGAALMLSVGQWMSQGIQEIQGLSVEIGVSICHYLNALGVDVGLKWPNDLWIRDAKMAGILMEVQGDQDQTFVVLGFGLNLKQPLPVDSIVSAVDSELDRAWTDQDSAGLIESILSSIANYAATSSETRVARYGAVSVLEGRVVNVKGASSFLTGIAQGIDEFGRLCVLNQDGIHSVSAGEVSVRPGSCNY